VQWGGYLGAGRHSTWLPPVAGRWFWASMPFGPPFGGQVTLPHSPPTRTGTLAAVDVVGPGG
jgi:hypothetical protein